MSITYYLYDDVLRLDFFFELNYSMMEKIHTKHEF